MSALYFIDAQGGLHRKDGEPSDIPRLENVSGCKIDGKPVRDLILVNDLLSDAVDLSTAAGALAARKALEGVKKAPAAVVSRLDVWRKAHPKAEA